MPKYSHKTRGRLLGLLTFLTTAAVQAEPLGAMHLIESGPGKIDLLFQSDLWTSPKQNKENPIRIYNLGIKYPLALSEQWKFTGQIQTEGLRIGNAGLSVGRNKVDIGGDLRSQSLSIGLEKTNTDTSSTTVFSTYGSDSDQPFQSNRDVAVDLIAYHRFVPNGGWQWVAGFDQTKNRGFLNDKLIPIVGVIYRPSGGFRAILGFPFVRLDWEQGDLKQSLLLSPVRVEGQLSFDYNDSVRLFTRAGISNRAYLHSQRHDDDARIIFEERYISLSALRKVSDRAFIESSFGYAFDRRLYEAKNVFDPIGEAVAAKSDFFGNLKIGFQF